MVAAILFQLQSFLSPDLAHFCLTFILFSHEEINSLLESSLTVGSKFSYLLLFESHVDLPLSDSILLHIHGRCLRVVHDNDIIIWLSCVCSFLIFPVWENALVFTSFMLFLRNTSIVLNLKLSVPNDTTRFHINDITWLVVFDFTHVNNSFNAILRNTNELIKVLVVQNKDVWSHNFPEFGEISLFIFWQNFLDMLWSDSN